VGHTEVTQLAKDPQDPWCNQAQSSGPVANHPRLEVQGLCVNLKGHGPAGSGLADH